MSKAPVRILKEGIYRYHPNPKGMSWDDIFKLPEKYVKVFIIEWYSAGYSSDPSCANAVVEFRETAHNMPNEALPVTVGAIREVVATSNGQDYLTVLNG